MAAKLTPVMKQHAAAKNAHPDCIIFFRLGDFYEMFGEDAVVVSELLGLTLTSRNKGKPDELPMAGLPHHAAHSYIARLLALGRKVAICEQMADPSTVKGIVPREVVRVITPGTWNPEGDVPSGSNNWLCSLELTADGVGVALLDLSTAELMAAAVPDLSAALAELGRACPQEVLLSPGTGLESVKTALSTVLPDAQLREGDAMSPREVQVALRGIDWQAVDSLAGSAAARVLQFARHCYQGKEFPVWRVAQWNPTGILGLDRAAQRHLELVESTVGDNKATLLAVLDRTGSPGGARLLRRRLLAPLTDIEIIVGRLDEVQTLVNNTKVRSSVKKALSALGDLERLAVRGCLGDANPRDLGNVRKGLNAATEVVSSLKTLALKEEREIFGVSGKVDLVVDLYDALCAALVDRPPAQAKEGAIFQTGFDKELDELAALRLSGSERMTALEQELKDRLGVTNLRVRFNRVFGWYVEVSRAHSHKVPSDWRRKQTVANGERFTLLELDELSEEVQSADSRFRTRELTLLQELSERLSACAERVHMLTAHMSAVDVAISLAEVAVEFDYCRPLVDSSDRLYIKDGRHAVVERLAEAGKFVPNDLDLTIRLSHLHLISGPNMAGKSTFLRQVALCVVLAQMGSFVPAREAHIGVVDKVLSRVGASDNLAGGESTFMVEMRETANILRTATSRSMVILDEVGRGTSTFDGLAIAWAVAEHLDEVVQCRSLFATHYHELTQFAEESLTAANYCVSARHHNGDIVFLHRVVPGAASRSYGVAVAQLAGLPEAVLGRARSLLESLENKSSESTPAHCGKSAQLELIARPPVESKEDAVLAMLREVDPDRMTGIEALQLLEQLRKRLKLSAS